ncbi:hypothetical protein BDR03DRAFT_953391 [Suillus americanus]|nr:hypothetical protein BDR03DRAFT_953391 [Suillus americanus]
MGWKKEPLLAQAPLLASALPAPPDVYPLLFYFAYALPTVFPVLPTLPQAPPVLLPVPLLARLARPALQIPLTLPTLPIHHQK